MVFFVYRFSINLATNYIAFRASSLPLIKVWLAEKGCSLVTSGNAEQGQARFG